jgi:hypothetical protein
VTLSEGLGLIGKTLMMEIGAFIEPAEQTIPLGQVSGAVESSLLSCFMISFFPSIRRCGACPLRR